MDMEAVWCMLEVQQGGVSADIDTSHAPDTGLPAGKSYSRLISRLIFHA